MNMFIYSRAGMHNSDFMAGQKNVAHTFAEGRLLCVPDLEHICLKKQILDSVAIPYNPYILDIVNS